MKTKRIGWRVLSVCLPVVLRTTTVPAIEPIPQESGFSGYVNLGAAYIEAESNMIKGTKVVSFGRSTIDSIFEGPDSESDVAPILNGELAYTFAESRTQIYCGNQLEDFLRFDYSTLLGVRQELPDKSAGEISHVFSGIATEVWKDPYVANVPRDETDRTTNGMRLEWERFGGTMLGVQYQWRKIDIDDELSGTLGGWA